MRLALILCVLMLTAGTFYFARNSLSEQLQYSALSLAENSPDVVDVEALKTRLVSLEDDNERRAEQLDAAMVNQERLNDENEAAVAQLNDTEATISRLIATNEALDGQVSWLAEERVQDRAQFDSFVSEADALNEALDAERSQVAVLEADLARVVAENISLVERVGSEGNTSTETSAIDDDQLIEMQERIDQMAAAANEAEQRVVELQSEAEQQAIKIVTMTGEAAAADSEIAALGTEVSNLSRTLQEREASIEELRASAETDIVELPTLSSCTEQTGTIFVEQKLTFDRGTDAIADASVPSLEQLTAIAQQCADAGLILEIGGHTDSQGGEISNQRLSEERARLVLDFLYAGGVPSVAMRAVGYGENNPVANNATSDGRSENRRITFEWLHP